MRRLLDRLIPYTALLTLVLPMTLAVISSK